MTKRGRPPLHADVLTARRAANARAAGRARAGGLLQRSVTLPADCRALIRSARQHTETSDSQTLARIILAAGIAAENDPALQGHHEIVAGKPQDAAAAIP